MADNSAVQQTQGSSVNAPNQGKFFYGWWIVIGGFMIMATCYTSYVNCIPLFQAHIVGDLGMTIGEYNTGTSLASLISIVGTLFIGVLIDKIRARLLASILVILSGCLMFAYSTVTAPWQVYLLAAMGGVFVTAGTRLFVSVTITNWFNLKRGLAVSLALCGSGLGGAVLSPVVSNIIASAGWRPAMMVLGVICLVASLPIPLIFFRNKPSDKGLVPYGAHLSEEEIKAAENKKKKYQEADPMVNVSVGWKVLRKNVSFWLLAIGFFLMGAINAEIVVNNVSNMTSVTVDGVEVVTGGHSVVWAGYVMSLQMIVVLFAKIIMGSIFDRFGMVKASWLGALMCALASIALCFPTTDIGPILAAIFFGFGTCLATIGPSIMVTKQFGRRDAGKLTGIIVAVQSFGGIVGAIVSGQTFDAFGSFIPAWIIALVLSVIMGAAMAASVKTARTLVAKRIEEGAPMVDDEGNEIPA